jgi:hypothetical protein
MRTHPWSSIRSWVLPLAFVPSVLAASACGGSGGGGGPTTKGTPPVTGQSDFESAPPYGMSGGSGTAASFGGAGSSGGGAPTAAGDNKAAAPPQASGSAATAQPRTVQETDLYRLDGNHLYYLNAYRGLMVFDVSNVDQPKLLGRSAIFGTPVQMFVNNGIAVVVVADWYGRLDSGEPFHGSIVRGFDATDPANIKVLGDAKLGGWVQDTRIVGNVLYAVSEDYGWTYGWAIGGGGGGGVAVSSPSSTANRASVIVSSVNFAGGNIQQIASKTYAGYGGVFNVTPSSIMLAHPVAPAQPNLPPPAKTTLQYLDISDPAGNIVERGTIDVAGDIQGWGADNGRWNLDFSDGKIAHVIGCAGGNYGCGSGYILAIADFTNPDAPKLDSELAIPPSNGWSAAARFDSGRMYLSPSGYYSSANGTTPLEIFDLSTPTAPALAGQTQIPGSVWLMIPSGNQLFALGQDNTFNASQVSLKYLDVSNAAAPKLIGTSNFGDGWAWTPAAQTFKAFTRGPDPNSPNLVVLPFSGWSSNAQAYNNGVQLIEYTPTSIATAGAAHTKGWVERGIFANGRILSLSDLALSVVDYKDPLAPTVTAELTLARNVVAAQPAGSTVAEISSDWWGNDHSQSHVRALPIADAAENFDESMAPDAAVPGDNAQVFTNGTLAYVVTEVQVNYPCPVYQGQPQPQPLPNGKPQLCTTWQQHVTVVDVSGGGAKVRGTIPLPIDPNGYYYGGWGWGGFYAYDWYYGGEIVQVGTDALAFRRWHSYYGPNWQYVHESSDLYVVDLSNPDAPAVASTVITNDPNGWWGNMKVVGNTLYTTHYVWPQTSGGNVQNPRIRYYLDAIDLTDRKNPKVQAAINVPGILVGGSQTDPSILYTIDYRWNSGFTNSINDFDVIKLQGGKAYLQSTTPLDGWVGNVFVRGNTAYTSTEKYVYTNTQPGMELHQIDISSPTKPVDLVASGPGGWGWLLGVEGDRMLVTSGWGDGNGLDIYRLSPNAAPAYAQFVRTQGWSINAVARKDNQVFLSSGYWGVQSVQLQ